MGEAYSRTKEDPALPGTEEDPRDIPRPRRHLPRPVRQKLRRSHGKDGDEGSRGVILRIIGICGTVLNSEPIKVAC